MKLNRADHEVILNLVPDGEYRSCVEVRIRALTKYYESATHRMLDEEDEEQITSLARARFPTLPYDDLSAPRLDPPRTYAETVASRPKPGTSREGGKARQIRLERESEKSRLQTAKIYYATRLTWIGTVVDGGGVIYIGGIGGSGQAPSEAVATAFPAVNGTFK
jgi:hypothetical protein